MKIQELKKRVWRVWSELNSFKGDLTGSPQTYVREVKSFGDRRYKKTWISALARLEAAALYRNCLDAWLLITDQLNFTPDRWDYEFRNEILDEFLMYENGLELIKEGLDQIFVSNDFSAEEQWETRNNGFFELLERRESQHRRIGLSAGPIRQLAGAHTAA